MIKSKRAGVLLALAIFFLGLVCGIILSAIPIFHGFPPGPMMMGKKQDDKMVNFMKKRLSRQLKLSEEQKAKLNEISQKHKIQMEKLASEVHPRFKTMRAKIDEDILSILTPEQKIKYEKMKKRTKKFAPRAME
ncbi:MAG: hypothetical protein A2252_04125 [Elusimicrobia bacterium RIFOXYA2_FULL_39_19]|nr:MAG: hypothetical protein A2252_04125 [Elusimicrobia bacterium RIFOXYA2_FULL_39_19]